MSEPTVKIEFPQEELHTIVQQWVLKQMNEDQRDAVLAQAVAYLMTPAKPNQYDRTPPLTPLQEAFNSSIRTVLFKIVRELIEEDPATVQAIRTAVGTALQEFFTQSWDAPGSKFVESLADAFADYFSAYRDKSDR